MQFDSPCAICTCVYTPSELRTPARTSALRGARCSHVQAMRCRLPSSSILNLRVHSACLGHFFFLSARADRLTSNAYSYALGCTSNLVMPCVVVCFRPYSIQSGIVVMIRTPTGCLATKLSVSARACHEGWARPQCGPDPSFEGLCVGEEAGPCFLEAMLQQSLGLDDELHMSRLSNVVHPCLYSSCAQLIGLS